MEMMRALTRALSPLAVQDLWKPMWQRGRRHCRPRFGGCSVCHAWGQRVMCDGAAPMESQPLQQL